MWKSIVNCKVWYISRLLITKKFGNQDLKMNDIQIFQSTVIFIGREETISQGKIIKNINLIWLKETF